MAVNQVSLDLYPPNRKQVVTYNSGATIIDSVEISDLKSSEIDPIIEFLEKKLFLSHNYRINSVRLTYGEVNSFFGDEKEIEVNLYHKNKKLESILIRFTLSLKSKKSIVFWDTVLKNLCQYFQLRVTDLDGNNWTDNFQTLIKKNQNWQDLCEVGIYK